ncbi:MAG: DUF5683 domain-containing protein [Cyclobacteriaceae bacterium]|uniref:DUF5683 domain-containing protein n=1 Tax=Algoriphagus marincola TaxID=264027 RepID=UPI00200B73B3|nr:DUF5683 domain-containing protein [Algoriphagus marincola]MCR9081580.1 DUF5683 domain-containing protein [Cyclobacteriaceae bacterium]
MRSHLLCKRILSNLSRIGAMGVLFWLLAYSAASAQQDTIRVEERKSKREKPDYSSLPKNPRKATMLSAILPGAGQVYNGKAWKVPILYAGFMADIYFIGYNNRRYQVFREALFAFDDGEPNLFPSLNRDALVRNVDYWRRNRDLTILLLGVIYALNIIDANVDAHLSGFDISDELSLAIEPSMQQFAAQNQSLGISVKLKFK